MSDWKLALAIVGLAALTVLTRGFFFLTEREIPIPAWLRQGLRYAPLPALAAVVMPEIVLTQGRLIGTLLDELERQDKQVGLATLCVASGMGAATIIERV